MLRTRDRQCNFGAAQTRLSVYPYLHNRACTDYNSMPPFCSIHVPHIKPTVTLRTTHTRASRMKPIVSRPYNFGVAHTYLSVYPCLLMTVPTLTSIPCLHFLNPRASHKRDAQPCLRVNNTRASTVFITMTTIKEHPSKKHL